MKLQVPMSVTRAAALVLGGGLLAAWFAAAAGTRMGAPGDPPSGRVSAPPAVGTSDLSAEAARLRDRLNAAAVFKPSSRNPFQFARPVPKPSPASSAAEPVAPAPPPMIALPPLLRLSGIAEHATTEGVVRTAIISAGGELFLVKEGETVAARYRVVRIGTDVVELADLADGAPVRIAMRN